MCFSSQRNCHHQRHMTIPFPKPGCNTINLMPYRVSHSQKAIIEKLVKQMLSSGIIRPSQSPFSSPIQLVEKKEGDWRFYVDYMKLNDITIKNMFPIPIIDDLLDELNGPYTTRKLIFEQVITSSNESSRLSRHTMGTLSSRRCHLDLKMHQQLFSR